MIKASGFHTSIHYSTQYLVQHGVCFISISGAYALTKKRMLFRNQINLLIVFTMWFTAGMIPLYLTMSTWALTTDGYHRIIRYQAYNVILLRNYFSGIPKEIDEAATVDGANEYQLLYKYICLCQRHR